MQVVTQLLVCCVHVLVKDPSSCGTIRSVYKKVCYLYFFTCLLSYLYYLLTEGLHFHSCFFVVVLVYLSIAVIPKLSVMMSGLQ